jgi:tetratricopeptide (TPR) repeat protein
MKAPRALSASPTAESLRRPAGLVVLAAGLLACAPHASAQSTPRAEDDFDLAIGLVQRGLHDDAIPALERFVAAHPQGHPRSAEAWYRLGSCRVERLGAASTEGAEDSDDVRRELGRARDAFERALATAARDFHLRAEAEFRLATTHQRLGDHERALAAFAVLVERTDDEDRGAYLRPAARYAAGECALALGRRDEAKAWFLAAGERDEEGADESLSFAARYQAARIGLEDGAHDEALDLFSELADEHEGQQDAGDLSFLAGEAAYRGRAFDVAERLWQRALEQGTQSSADARLGLAWCAVERGDDGEARRRFTEVIAKHEDWAGARDARLELARLLRADDDAGRALEILVPIVAADDPAIAARANELAGLALLDLGRADDALGHLDEALDRVEDGPARTRLLLARADAIAEQDDADAPMRAAEAYAAAERCERERGAAADPTMLGDALHGALVALHRAGEHDASLARARALVRELEDHPSRSQAEFAIAENLFALERWQEALAAYEKLDDEHPDAPAARFKAAWCAYLAGDVEDAAERFTTLATDEAQPERRREESLSMVVLACHDAGLVDAALEAADIYRARYRDGAFLGRTERIAGRILRNRGDLRAAAQRLEQAAVAEASGGASGGGGSDVRLEQADVLYRTGDFEAAVGVYRDLAETDPQGVASARALEGLAWCAFELGDADACEKAIDRALAHPRHADVSASVLELRVTLRHASSNHEGAAEAARAFLERHPDHERAPEVRYALGLALSRSGRWDEAVAVLEPLAGQGGCARMDRVHYELAWAKRRRGDEQGAMRAFAAVVAASEDTEPELADEARLHLAETRFADGEGAAARALLSAVATTEHRPRALYRIAYSLLEADEPRAAIEPLSELVGLDTPLRPDARLLLGAARIRTDEPDAALAPLRELLRETPEHERAQDARLTFGRAAVAVDADDARAEADPATAAEAVAVLEEWLRRDRRQASAEQGEAVSEVAAAERELACARAYLLLGRAHALRGAHDAAEAAFAETIARTDTDLAAEALYRTGRARAAAGRLDAAAEAWVRLGILYAQEPWVPLGLAAAADAYERLGQPTKAARFREELRARYPDAANRPR